MMAQKKREQEENEAIAKQIEDLAEEEDLLAGLEECAKQEKRELDAKREKFTPREETKKDDVVVAKDQQAGQGEQKSENKEEPKKESRLLHYCHICNKGFKDKYSVNVHVRTHTREKPFSCQLCGKCFRQKAHLAKHQQTHASKQQGSGEGQSQSSSSSLIQITSSEPDSRRF